MTGEVALTTRYRLVGVSNVHFMFTNLKIGGYRRVKRHPNRELTGKTWNHSGCGSSISVPAKVKDSTKFTQPDFHYFHVGICWVIRNPHKTLLHIWVLDENVDLTTFNTMLSGAAMLV
jgi:hypothetical protein